MSKIYIGFSTTSNPGSWLIRKASGTPYSHTFVMFHSAIFNRDMVCHAAKSFVHFLNFKKFQEHTKLVEMFGIEVTAAERVQIMSYCLDKAGAKYGFTTLLGIGLSIGLSKLGIKWSNPFSDGANSYICSEMISDICNILVNNFSPESRKLFPSINAERNGMKAIRDRVKMIQEARSVNK